jgi:Glycosyltransferase family 87
VVGISREPGTRSNSRMGVLSFVVAVVAFLACLSTWGWHDTFLLFRVPPMQPIFSDLRPITGAWISAAQGLDPYVQNPGDPLGRRLNYPALWDPLFRMLARVGDPVLIFGTAQAAAFVALGLYLSRRRWGLLVTCLALSPPLLLLLERGNCDGLTFLLVLAGIRSRSVVGGALVGLATALKVYPAAAIVAGLAFRSRRAFATGVLLTSPLIVLTALQIPKLAAATPVSAEKSFGSLALARLFINLKPRLGFEALPETPTMFHPATLVILALLLIATVAIWLVMRSAYREACRRVAALDPTTERMFFGFLTLFLGIFCAGGSFAYRIIFLFPVIWVLGQLVAEKSDRLTTGLLILGVGLLYTPFLPKGWSLFGPVVFLYAALIAPILIEAASQAITRPRAISMP